LEDFPSSKKRRPLSCENTVHHLISNAKDQIIATGYRLLRFTSAAVRGEKMMFLLCETEIHLRRYAGKPHSERF
jgi:hypothetical protein